MSNDSTQPQLNFSASLLAEGEALLRQDPEWALISLAHKVASIENPSLVGPSLDPREFIGRIMAPSSWRDPKVREEIAQRGRVFLSRYWANIKREACAWL